MSRLMSVAFTEDAVRKRTKTVTRRLGWANLEAGQQIQLCRKVMGRKKGEPLERIVEVTIADVRRERLSTLFADSAYGAAEMTLEGFPGLDPREFVDRYFVQAQKASHRSLITRIEWTYPTCIWGCGEPVAHPIDLCRACTKLQDEVVTGRHQEWYS